MFIYKERMGDIIIRYATLKSISKALSNKRSQLVRDITKRILKGDTEDQFCSELGINTYLYRYYLTNYNKELRKQLSDVRKYRRTYQREQELRKIRRKIDLL